MTKRRFQDDQDSKDSKRRRKRMCANVQEQATGGASSNNTASPLDHELPSFPYRDISEGFNPVPSPRLISEK